MTVNTKRVTLPPTASITARVATSGAVPSGAGGDPWRGSWGGFTTRGNAWRQTWINISAGVAASPVVDTTVRVSGAITENTTKRISVPVADPT